MKKLKLILIGLFLISQGLKAQMAEVDGNLVSAGFGFGFGWVHTQSDEAPRFPSFYARYERGVLEVGGVGILTVGGQLGVHTRSHGRRFSADPVEDITQESWTKLYLFPTVVLTFQDVFNGLPSEMELYFGLGAGVMLDVHTQRTWQTTDFNNDFGFGYNVFLGVRYALTRNLGAFAEFGWGTSVINVGVTISL